MIVDSKIPEHVGIIMDGNGRWAKKQGAARIFGHKNAIKSVRDCTEFCAESGISFLTLFAFSTENWKRPQFEVDGLMSLLVSTINKELPTLVENKVSLSSIGDSSGLPENARKNLNEAIEDTKNNDGLKLILALNYSGKWDITQAFSKLSAEIESGSIRKEDINEDLIESNLSTEGIPAPELIIRTSGEKRISNFYLWQAAYSELYFCDTLWPDFRKEHFELALNEFQRRERRFGQTSEQILDS